MGQILHFAGQLKLLWFHVKEVNCIQSFVVSESE